MQSKKKPLKSAEVIVAATMMDRAATPLVALARALLPVFDVVAELVWVEEATLAVLAIVPTGLETGLASGVAEANFAHALLFSVLEPTGEPMLATTAWVSRRGMPTLPSFPMVTV